MRAGSTRGSRQLTMTVLRVGIILRVASNVEVTNWLLRASRDGSTSIAATSRQREEGESRGGCREAGMDGRQSVIVRV